MKMKIDISLLHTGWLGGSYKRSMPGACAQRPG